MTDVIETAKILSALPVQIVKLHSLYIPKGSKMYEEYKEGKITLCDPKEYLDRLVNFICYVRKDMVIERLFSRVPKEDASFSNWGISWWKLKDRFDEIMEANDYTQGCKSVYKVTEDKITNTLSFTGIAIRDEELLKASQSGYITYYVEEGKRIKKSGTVFTVDKDQKVQDAFVSQVQQLEKNKKVIDDDEIQHKITDYQSVYSDHKFSTVYDLKYDLKNAILNLSEDSMKTVIEAVKQKLGDTSFETQKSTSSGVTQFYSDDFDGKSAKDITSKDFDQSNYRIQKYNTSDKVKKGKVVARINKSEKWQIVIPLEADQYRMLKDKSEVSVRFLQDQTTATATVEVAKKGSSYFGYLKFNDYAVRYINERYLEIDVTLDSYKGLKIPNTSIVKKKFYQVPVKYLTKGDNSAKEQFTVRDTSNKGDVTVEQKSFTIYGRTKDYCYLDPEEVGENVVLQAMDSKDTFLIEKMKTLKGVYCTNQGYADFRPIDVLIEKDDYSIIANDTNQGVSRYDFIVLDGTTIKENQIIY